MSLDVLIVCLMITFLGDKGLLVSDCVYMYEIFCVELTLINTTSLAVAAFGFDNK